MADAAVLSDAFAHEWGSARFVPVAVGDELFRDAASLVAGYGPRPYDGIQLACVFAARRADPGIDTDACFDRKLTEAAVREGFRLLTG